MGDAIEGLLFTRDQQLAAESKKLATVEKLCVSLGRKNQKLADEVDAFVAFASTSRFCHDVPNQAVPNQAVPNQAVSNQSLKSCLQNVSRWCDIREADRVSSELFLSILFPSDDLIKLECSQRNRKFDLPTLQSRWTDYEESFANSIATIQLATKEQLGQQHKRIRQLEQQIEFLKNLGERQKLEICDAAKERGRLLVRQLRPEVPSSVKSQDKTVQTISMESETTDPHQLPTPATSEESDDDERARNVAEQKMDQLQADYTRASVECSRLRQDLSRHQLETRELLRAKDLAAEKLRAEIRAQVTSASTDEFLLEIAARQAEIEKSTKSENLRLTIETENLKNNLENQRKANDHLRSQLGHSPNKNDCFNVSYLRHVIIKTIVSLQSGDPMAAVLLPVVATLLQVDQSELSVPNPTGGPKK